MISTSLSLVVLFSNQLTWPVPSVQVPGLVGDEETMGCGKISRAVEKGWGGDRGPAARQV